MVITGSAISGFIHHYPLDLKNPKTFNAKIQWIKIYGHLERYSKYVDKSKVREYVKTKIDESYIIPLLGVYDSWEDIDFNNLPSSFVLKTTHGSSWNIIVKNKKNLDWAIAKKKMSKWLKTNFYDITGENQYREIKGRIIIEKFINDPSGELKDYKFFCFSGEPLFIQVDSGRFTDHKRNIYDINWNKLPVQLAHENIFEPVIKPEKLKEMTEVSKALSKDFPFVRVDLYYTNDKIYFGELTFTPGNGFEAFIPNSYDYKLGELINLDALT